MPILISRKQFIIKPKCSTININSTIFILIIWAFSTSISNVYSQRVYANSQQTGKTLFASVSNAARAADANYTNYSTLNVTLGALGLIYAQQNLQFTGAITPKPTSPIIIKFSSSNALVGLVDGIIIQRTNGGISNTVGTTYSENSLLNLINLNADGNATEVSIPVPGTSTPSNGIRLRINTALGVALSTNLYYAFFIAPPILTNNNIVLCEGEEGLIGISNFQSGYTYRLYNTLTGGNPIANGTTAVVSIISNIVATGNYYLEAVETNTGFTSSRTLLTITKHPKPRNPNIIINVNEN